MWTLALRLLLDQAKKEPFRRAGKTLAGTIFTKELNAPEVYVERIKRDHRLADYYDAWQLYNSDPDHWHRYYNPPPDDIEAKQIFVRDSAAQSGVSGRRNVFEYGYPESDSKKPIDRRPHVGSGGYDASFADRFGNWSPFQTGVTPARGESDHESAVRPDIRRLTKVPPAGR